MGDEVTIFTFKEGLLSRVAHDLKLRASHIELQKTPEGQHVVRVSGDGLKVVCAMEKGIEAPARLSAADKAQIEKNLQRDVLETHRFPEIQFETQKVTPTSVGGRLTLHGVIREKQFPLRAEGSDWLCDFELDQRDFGIKPYQAMLGALKVAPVVKVSVRLSQSRLQP